MTTELDNLEKDIERLYDETKDSILIKDRLLDDCLGEQVTLQVKWERMVGRAKRIYAEAKRKSETTYAIAYRTHLEGSRRSLSTTDAKFFAEGTTDYVDARKAEIRAYGALEEAEAVLKAVTSRQFALKDLTNAIVAGVNRHII